MPDVASRTRPAVDVELQVPFHDVDALQVVWHGHYLKYFEVARDALFARAGFDLYRFAAEREYVFPVVRTATKHIHPLRRGDRFRCRAELVDARSKLVVEYVIRLAADDRLCARGRTEQVAVTLAGGLEFSIPVDVRRALGVDH